MDQISISNQYIFPEEEQKGLIVKYKKYKQGLIEQIQNDNQLKIGLLTNRKDEIEAKLYVIMRSLQIVIINKKVMKKDEKYFNSKTNLIDGDQQIFEDLVIHSVQQMFAYIDKIDLKRKLYSILQKIQNKQSLIHYFKFYAVKNTIFITDNSTEFEEDSDFEYMLDKLYYEKNKNTHNDFFDELTQEQIMEMELDENSILNKKQLVQKETNIANLKKISDMKNYCGNTNWVYNFEIFEKVDKILKYGFCEDFKGILIKLYIINVLVYENIKRYNKNLNKFTILMESKTKYIKTKFNLKTGFEKIIKIFISDYLKKDPFIYIGFKAVSLYSSLILYLLLVENKIPTEQFTENEIKSMANMRHELSDITQFLVQEEAKNKFDFKTLVMKFNFSLCKEQIGNKLKISYVLANMGDQIVLQKI